MSNQLYRVPDTYDWNVFRDHLRQLMDSHGYNMVTLADKANLNITSISRYLKGRIPDIIAAWRIADHFGVSLDWLIGRVEDTHSTLTEDQQVIIDMYSKASPADKEVIRMILNKYNG